MKRFFNNKENRIIFFISLFTLIAACVPLFTRLCINGHDLEYHLLRIESLKEGILAGRPFLKVNMLFFGGAGYASSMFYPDFLLYFPAALRALGVSINTSYHAFVAFCIILCYISAYLCAKGITGSKYAGVIAAVLITLCNYHIEDIYVRSAVGEFTAFIFLPAVLYGMYNLFYQEFDKPYVLSIGFGGLLLCHTGTLILCLVAALLFFLVKLKIFIKKPILLLKLFATAVLTAGATCFYWLPVLEQFYYAWFKVSIPWVDPADEAVAFSKLFYSEFPSIGAGLILIYILRVFINKRQIPELDAKIRVQDGPGQKYDNIISFADLVYCFGAISALFATGLFPWDRFGKYMTFLQFPWRLFIISSAFFAMADGLLMFCLGIKAGLHRFFSSPSVKADTESSKEDLLEQKSSAGQVRGSGTETVAEQLRVKSDKGTETEQQTPPHKSAGGVVSLAENLEHKNSAEWIEKSVLGALSAVVFIIFALSAFSVMERNDQGYYDYSDDYYSYAPYTANVIAGEWLPITVADAEAVVGLSDRAVNDRGEEVRFERHKNEIEFVLDDACGYVDVPFIYYKGYEAVKDDGTVLYIDDKGNNGFARVYCDKIKPGIITVRYAGTELQMLSAIVSIVSIVVILICVLVYNNKRSGSR